MPSPERTPSQHRAPLRRAPRHHTVFNACVAILVVALAYVGLAGQAVGPAYGDVAAPVETPEPGRIETASIAATFAALETFTGPNRAEKRDRALPVVEIMAFTRGFESARVRIASLRDGPLDPTDAPQSTLASIQPQAPAIEEDFKISIAAVPPGLISPALDAIQSLVPDAPQPQLPSEQTAYARANEPATDFTVVRNTDGKIVSDKELWCLATAIYFESRGETYRGQVAVAQVVLNRLKHPIYPKTICGVVFQNQSRRDACQFSFACDGIPEHVTDRKSWEQAEEIAEGTVRGNLYLTEVGKATHYHATYVRPKWAPRMSKVVKIGLHVFYQFKTGWRFG
jgi:spore germination cell wall hydrolase CwlJ-like protein